MANLDLLRYDEYVARLPRKRIPLGFLQRDETGRALLVEPSYKPNWDVPGGVVEAGKALWVTAMRELDNEWDIARPLGQLLVIDHIPLDSDSLPERVAFMFDGGRIAEDDLEADRFVTVLAAARSDATVVCQRAKRVI